MLAAIRATKREMALIATRKTRDMKSWTPVFRMLPSATTTIKKFRHCTTTISFWSCPYTSARKSFSTLVSKMMYRILWAANVQIRCHLRELCPRRLTSPNNITRLRKIQRFLKQNIFTRLRVCHTQYDLIAKNRLDRHTIVTPFHHASKTHDPGVKRFTRLLMATQKLKALKNFTFEGFKMAFELVRHWLVFFSSPAVANTKVSKIFRPFTPRRVIKTPTRTSSSFSALRVAKM